MSEGGGGSGRKWLAIAATAGLVAGAGFVIYKYVYADDEEEEVASPAQLLAPVRKTPIAPHSPQSKQKRAGSPDVDNKSPTPAVSKPKGGLGALPPKRGALASTPAGASTSASTSAGAGTTNLKQCALCKKGLTGLPLRCSQCKTTYYCSPSCQKKAWPDHKAVCSGARAKEDDSAQQASTSSTAADVASEITPAQTSAVGPSTTDQHDQPANTAARDADATASSSKAGVPPATLQHALVQVLKQQTDSHAGTLEGAFEKSVMMFVQGETRGALEAFTSTQARAKADGNMEMFGDLYKWIGHANNRLANVDKAKQVFSEGAAFAEQASRPKLEVECLCGLGMAERGRGNFAAAIQHLNRAIDRARGVGETDQLAMALSNLGAALSSAGRTEEGLQCLQESVSLRQDLVEAAYAADDRSALAAAIMEHATSLINLASTLMALRKTSQAKAAYLQALDVFELMEDVDKICKVLANLHNLTELQEGDFKEALQYRGKLVEFLEAHDQRIPSDTCPICLDPLRMAQATVSPDKAVLLLACLHPVHDTCFKTLVEVAQQKSPNLPVGCPTCREPVPLFD